MKDQFGKAFCVLPWLHSFVNIGGEYQVCCTSEEFHKGITDNYGKFFNIKDKPTIEEVMNSDFMKKVRLDMLDGKMPKLCTRCIVTENMDGISRRMLDNGKYANLVEDLIENTTPDGTIPVNISHADYRLGNICNLQCRMCNPRSTVMWIKDWNELKGPSDKLPDSLMKEYEGYDWINEDYLLDEFESKIKNLDFLHFAGGEPLIAPRMAKMLQICIDKGVADKICLTYNTNTTRLPPKILELWTKFKEVRLLCSVDGYGKVNDYIRMPVKWDVIDKNLRFLDDNAADLKLTDVKLSTTIQAYNILNIDQLFNYLDGFKNIIKVPNLIDLYAPHYLLTQILPKDVKEEATKRLRALQPGLDKKLTPDKHYLLDNINQIINFMNSKDLEGVLWKEFIEYNKRIDEKKGTSLKECIPELYAAVERTV